MSELEKAFNLEMQDIYKNAAVHKIYFRRLNGMILKYGGLNTAKILIGKKGISKGYQRLIEIDRKELSVEFLVTKEKYKPLFTEKEFDSANTKLNL